MESKQVTLDTFAAFYLECEPGDPKAERLIEKYAMLAGIDSVQAHVALDERATEMAMEKGAA